MSDDREALLRNPTNEGALKFWDYARLGPPKAYDTPLAGVHKARLVWPGATRKMRQESRRWLTEHGYGSIPGEVDPRVPRSKPLT